MKFPFSLKIGLAISLLSVVVGTASTGWLYYRTQGSLLQGLAQELKAIGVQAGSSLTPAEVSAIAALKQEMAALSQPLTPEMLARDRPVDFRGLRSKALEKKLLQSKTYQQLARRLGEITNASRRDDASDVYVMDTFLVVTVPASPNRKFLQVLVDDQGYRYENAETHTDSWVGRYYFPGSRSLAAAFDGKAHVDNEFYIDSWCTCITAGIPIADQSGKTIAVMGLDVDVRTIAKQLDVLKFTYLHVIGISLLLSVLVAYLLARWLGQPIAQLRLGAERVRSRNFDTAIQVKSGDELQLLAETFNAMILEIAKYTHGLEDLVHERTVQLIEVNQELATDIEKGQKLQRNFLPDPILTLPNWEISAVFEPAKKVAGDFYDVFPLPGDYVGLVIADVCDKGVGAAMFMGLFRSLIRIFSGQIALQGFSIVPTETDDVVNLVRPHLDNPYRQSNALGAVEITNNYIVKQHGETGMFATMFFGVLDPATGLLTYINGGHESLYILGSTGIKQILKSTGPVVGMIPDMHFKIAQVQLEPGDILIGYTDGVTDARSPNGEFFSGKRLLSLLSEPATTASDLLGRIKADVFTHIDCAPQFDDITMLAAQWIALPRT